MSGIEPKAFETDALPLSYIPAACYRRKISVNCAGVWAVESKFLFEVAEIRVHEKDFFLDSMRSYSRCGE